MNRLTVMIILGLLFSSLAYVISANVQGMAGSDDRAQDTVSSLTGGSYHAWMNSPWNPSSEMQRLLFSLQAGIGGMLLGFFFTFRKKENETVN